MTYTGFLNPTSIAVYGASERALSPAAHILRNLINQGYDGKITAINPKYQKVAGQPCAPSQVAGGLSVDLAVIAIPARSVPAAIQDCAAVGTRAAIVITAGFDDGLGAASYTRLAETAGAAGVRFIGPNCLGIVRPQIKLNATFQPAMPPVGGLALISQSGAICSSLADMAEVEGLGFSLMMSLGNSLDFGMADALDMASEDEKTRVILLYVEGVRHGTRFRTALREACRKKTVIVLKAGRHAQGAAAAATHTGALVGSDRVFSSVLADAGAVQVASFRELIETARLLDDVADIPGDRLAIITNGGGVGVLSADRLADRGLRPANLPSDIVQALDPILSDNWSRSNPIDIVGDATAHDYRAAVGTCLASDDFDAVLVLLSPQSMTAPETVADAILELRSQYSKPTMTCFLGGPSVASARAKLRRQGVADFDLPEDAVQAFAQALQASKLTRGHVAPTLIDGPKRSPVASATEALGALPDGMLGDAMSRKILTTAGIPCPVPEPAATPERAIELLNKFSAPVVLKIVSPDISHKSEVDGVRLNLATPEAVRVAFNGILARAKALRPDADVRGVTVEPMVNFPDARELLIGATLDPAFGPVLSFGAGGTLVELLDDVATAVLPLSLERATRLIAETKMGVLLGPFRNMAPVDKEALARLLVSVSDLAFALPNLAEMDINPLIASPAGFCAVDARIRIAAPKRPLLATGTQ